MDTETSWRDAERLVAQAQGLWQEMAAAWLVATMIGVAALLLA